MARWLQSKDEMEHPKVEFITVSKSKTGFLSKIRMRAKEDIKEGEEIYAFDLKQNALNIENALADEDLGEIFQKLRIPSENYRPKSSQVNEPVLFPDQILRLWLIHLRFVKSGEWKSFIENLPDELDVTINWTNEELDELKGSPLYKSTKKTLRNLKEEEKAIFPKLFENYPEKFPESIFSPENWKWSFTVFNSRFLEESKNVDQHVLPLMEVFNLAEESHVKLVEEESGILKLVAQRDIKSQETIVVNEKMLGNQDLLEYYGFALQKNTRNTWKVGVGLDPEDRMFGNKKEYLHRRNLKDGQEYAVTAAFLPEDLIYALRIYHTNVYDFENIDNALLGKPVSEHNELKVTQTLIQMCRTSLKRYRTSGKEDKALLEKENLTPRQRKAIILRRGEKKILLRALNKSKEMFEEVKKKWYTREMDIPGTPGMKASFETVDEEILQSQIEANDETDV